MQAAETTGVRDAASAPVEGRGRPEPRLLPAITLAAAALCLFVASPFATSLAWAIALAVVFAPLHDAIDRRLRCRSVAAAISVAGIALFAAVVVALVVPRLIGEAYAGLLDVHARIEAGTWSDAIHRYRWLGDAWDWVLARIDLHDLTGRIAALITSTGPVAVQWSAVVAIDLVLVFFFLFYFLRDRARILAAVRAVLPLPAPHVDRILESTRATVLATAYGTVLIGVIQGLLGGAMFWWLDIPAPWFWALIMALFSIVPLFGAPLIWVPAAAILVLEGDWYRAGMLTVWGALVVGLADNLLHPLVVGRYLHLHTLPLFLALVGGLIVFGSAGLFVGPVLLAVTICLLQIHADGRCDQPREAARIAGEAGVTLAPGQAHATSGTRR